MHIAVIVLSVLLAVEFAATGVMKVMATGTARDNAVHLGVSLRLSRLIGIAELAAVAGLLGGLAVKPLAVVTVAAVILLMVGAIGSHLKAGDKGAAVLPAVITGLAAIALLVLTVAG
jgi:DoxX-like family